MQQKCVQYSAHILQPPTPLNYNEENSAHYKFILEK